MELVNKPNLTTAETAYYLNRSPQTLRVWACRSGTGPMAPSRIGGLLAWSTATVKALAGVAA
nr:helix-turn-helix domain-containing protein [Rhodoferax bucti]